MERGITKSDVIFVEIEGEKEGSWSTHGYYDLEKVIDVDLKISRSAALCNSKRGLSMDGSGNYTSNQDIPDHDRTSEKGACKSCIRIYNKLN